MFAHFTYIHLLCHQIINDTPKINNHSKMKKFVLQKGLMVLMAVTMAITLLLTACSKDGDTIYQPDPDEPKISTEPLVTVIYGKDALGDRSYNDLIFSGVEKTAREYGLRTMQMSPTSYEEGLAYLQTMFQTVSATKNDTIRRLYIVCAAGYDEYIRQNAHVFAENPNADLLYLETPDPLPEGCGSTIYLPYYGAMYEAGALMPALKREALVIGSNPEDQTVAGAIKGFNDGFMTEYYSLYDPEEYAEEYSEEEIAEAFEKKISTVYLADHAGEGYNVADTTLIKRDGPRGLGLTSQMLRQAVTMMQKANSFRKLLIVAEPCYAECVVNLLDGIPGVLAMTGSSAQEQSWADNWNQSGNFWMCDRFTSNFVAAISEQPAITYRDLYLYCAQHTLGSHARIVNADHFGNLYHTGPAEFVRK